MVVSNQQNSVINGGTGAVIVNSTSRKNEIIFDFDEHN